MADDVQNNEGVETIGSSRNLNQVTNNIGQRKPGVGEVIKDSDGLLIRLEKCCPEG